MSTLTLPDDFPLQQIVTEVADGDTMFDGRSDHYLGVGLSALRLVEAAMLGAPPPRRILDLPCGFGRVTRALRARYPSAEITACDLDRPGVDFAAARFAARGAYSSPDFHDLELGARFDLIWVGSLLTHLPEHQARQFLDFAARHMAPGARLVVTSHGAHVAERLREWHYGLSPAAARGLLADHRMDGYGFRGYSGDPCYGISLASRAWFEHAVAGSPLCLQSFRERGWDRHQDAVTLRRRPARGWDALLRLGRRWGALRRLGSRAPGWFEATGTAAPPRPAAGQAAADDEVVRGFDEAWYRAAFPDVAAAVAGGAYPSGLAHFMAYGWAEGRACCDPAATFEGRAPASPAAYCSGGMDAQRQSAISDAWSGDPQAEAADAGWHWMAHPAVRARTNALASGDPATDAYGRLAQLLGERGWAMPIGRSVSLGCGFGGLERDLAARGIIREMDAYDIAGPAVAEARRQAARLGLLRVRYHVADLEAIALAPGSIDAVFAHSSVHHVERLEALYAIVQRALRPGGVFHLHEFVGPTRFQWTDAQLGLANAFLDSLPGRLRQLPSGQPKAPLRRPTVADMIKADPSEAVRSSDLVGALDPFFDVIETRQLGGALAHLALGEIAQNFDMARAEDRDALARLFAAEDAAMADGSIGSDFAVITAIPKPTRNIRRAGPSRPGNAMAQSIGTRASLIFPPARRLRDAVVGLHQAVGALQSQQDRMIDELAALRAEQARAAAAPPTPAAVPAPPPGDAAHEAEMDRLVARMLGEAALRHLPFLPGEFRLDEAGITVSGYAGAPEGITGGMAFFVNGERIDQVEYPIHDPALKAKFPDVEGMGLAFRATMTRKLEELRAARFWRFDASPTGRCDPANWRQAIHYMNPLFERFPLPPAANILRVIGDTSPERFAMGGATTFHNAQALLRELGHGWADFPRILDWGCGAGRLTRYLASETACEVTGVDIDADNIAWCQQAYPGATFQVVPLRPPTALPSGHFNLVFGISVLTHLQEEDQWLWLAELQRVLQPGALLFLSVQGPTQFAYNSFPPHLYRTLQRQGYIDFCRDAALDAVVSDKEYYRAAMHSRDYIVRRWGKYFDVLQIADAIAGLQDFVVMRRRAD